MGWFLLFIWALVWLVPRLLTILGFTLGFLAALDMPGWRSWGALALAGTVAVLADWLPSSVAVGLAAGLAARAASLMARATIEPIWRRSVTTFVFLAPLALLLSRGGEAVNLAMP